MTERSTGEQMCGSVPTSIRSSSCSRRSGSLWPRRSCSRSRRSPSCALGALPVFWLGRRHLGSERAAALLALGYLAYPWIATSAGVAIHPGDIRDPALSLLRLVPRHRSVCAVRVCARSLAMSTGELMGLPIAALGVWYALARREAARGRVDRRCWRRLDVVADLLSWFRGSAAVDSVYFGFYDQVADLPGRRRRRSSRIPARCSALLSRGTTSPTWSGSASRSCSSSCSRPGSPPWRFPSSWRTASRTSAR